MGKRITAEWIEILQATGRGDVRYDENLALGSRDVIRVGGDERGLPRGFDMATPIAAGLVARLSHDDFVYRLTDDGRAELDAMIVRLGEHAAALRYAASRKIAREHLSHLARPELLALARHTGIIIGRRRTAEELRDGLAEQLVGARLDSAAIRGHSAASRHQRDPQTAQPAQAPQRPAERLVVSTKPDLRLLVRECASYEARESGWTSEILTVRQVAERLLAEAQGERPETWQREVYILEDWGGVTRAHVRAGISQSPLGERYFTGTIEAGRRESLAQFTCYLEPQLLDLGEPEVPGGEPNELVLEAIIEHRPVDAKTAHHLAQFGYVTRGTDDATVPFAVPAAAVQVLQAVRTAATS